MVSKKFKEKLLHDLYEPYKKCIQCPLGTLGRKNVVFGEGNANASLMIIGEGPGQEEDAQGRPFVGRSGQLLNKLLSAAGIERENVYISNIVKCRPPGNRKPYPIESATCKSLLLTKQIKIIRPRFICTLGATALEGLLEKPIKITQWRGKQIPLDDIIVVPTYHPAYILRNPKELETMLDDLSAIASLLEQP